jgi:filamentous hemagglutinin
MAMLVHQQLYDGKPVSELTQAEKENIRAVATLASGLVGGVAGDSFENAATAASAGYNAAVNNNLAGEFLDEVLRAMDAFPGGSGVKLGAKYTIQEIKLLAKLFKFGKSADEAAAQLKKAPSEIELMYSAIEQRVAKLAKISTDFESSLYNLRPGERVALVKTTAAKVASEKGFSKDGRLSKLNGRDVYKNSSGNLLSLDTQHGRWELINSKTGAHQGELHLHTLGTVPNSIDLSGGHNLRLK